MIKSKFLLALIISAGLFTTVAAKADGGGRAIKNGFGINLVTGVPFANFGSSVNVDSKEQYNAILGLQLGNRWYIEPQDKYAFGIMVNWFDATIAGTTFTESFIVIDDMNMGPSTSNTDYLKLTGDLSLCAFGPICTFAINENMAVDAYYNLRPTMLVTMKNMTGPATRYNPEINRSDIYLGVGVSHAIGTAFRWKKFSVGVDYVFGSINCSYLGSDPIIYDITGAPLGLLDDEKLSTNSLRFHFGFKF